MTGLAKTLCRRRRHIRNLVEIFFRLVTLPRRMCSNLRTFEDSALRRARRRPFWLIREQNAHGNVATHQRQAVTKQEQPHSTLSINVVATVSWFSYAFFSLCQRIFAANTTASSSYRHIHKKPARTELIMIFNPLIALVLAVLPAHIFAQDIVYDPIHNMTVITGTWATGSKAVQTGSVSAPLSYCG